MIIRASDWKYTPDGGSIVQQGNKLYTDSTRLRSYLDISASTISTIIFKFTILGPTDIQIPDADGSIKSGPFIWINWQNICNTYLIGARTDSTKPNQSIIKAQKKINPGETSGTICAGINYFWLTTSTGGISYILISDINIADGLEHELKVVKLDVTKWNIYLDGRFIDSVSDPVKVFPDGKIGLRTDNVKMSFTFEIQNQESIVTNTSKMLIVGAGLIAIVLILDQI